MNDPLELLGRWIEEARERGLPHPGAVAFVTVGADARPSARTVTLKRIEAGMLIFTTALWTRKARELEANPNVALLFHWPSLGRQVHLTGRAARGERALSEGLFAERDPAHRLQTLVSRQGEPIESIEPLRERLGRLVETGETAPACPDDWGAIRVTPDLVEFWTESPDRLHDRRLFERDGREWTVSQLAP